MNEILNRLKVLKERFQAATKLLDLEADRINLKETEAKTSEAGFWSEPEKAQETMQKLSELKTRLETWDNLAKEIESLDEISKEINETEHEFITEIEANLTKMEQQLDKYELELLFSEKYDPKNAILSIHAGTGGTDAQDWTEMLLRMYLRFCEQKHLKALILNQSDGEEAGIKSVSIEIKGHNAFGQLKSEHGVHRLVRLSPYNADHARQTSFALVEVIPEIDVAQTKIDEKDLKIETFRAGGHGGQSVNTTDSAVRITHLPTGLTASSQNERSQLQNKQLALKVLQSRIFDFEEKKRQAENDKLKGDNISAEWGNQIRSYVLHPYTIVKDHRTEAETSNATGVLDGDIDLFIEAYLRQNVTK